MSSSDPERYEIEAPGETTEVSLASRVHLAINEAACAVKAGVLADARALADKFPQLEVGTTPGSVEQKGAIIRGLEGYPTQFISGVIVKHDSTTYYDDRYVVLTPDGLHEGGGVHAWDESTNGDSRRTVPKLTEQPLIDEDLFWLTHGEDAARRLDVLRGQPEESID